MDERLKAIITDYGLDKSDVWQLPQNNKTWLIKHAALEVVAVKAGVKFSPPTVLEADSANGLCAIVVTGTFGDRTEWSIGEASPKNAKNAYPWAIAEKRAKDRVILKLIGIHGLVYSEDEMPPAETVRQEQPAPNAGQSYEVDDLEMNSTAAKKHWKTIADSLFACTTLKQLQGEWARHAPIVKILPEDLQRELTTWKNELKDKLSAQAEASRPLTYVAPSFDDVRQ